MTQRNLKSALALFVFMAGFLALPFVAYAKPNPKYASIVMDADTGMILHQSRADKVLHPASLTKVMTLLLTFEALEQGRINLKDRVYISRHAASMVPSKIGLPAGSSIRIKDAIYALVTKSANDVAVALAEHLGGTERNFAHTMTRRARLIGMNKTTFKNASGLHDKGQVTTARDMAKLARTVIQQYPEYYRYFSTREFTYRGKTYRNHNKLLGKYNGMDGMKTGYINASGFNLVASAVRNNRRIIGVVFGGRSGKTRNDHMAHLLDRGFVKIKDVRYAGLQPPKPDRKPSLQLAANTAPTTTAQPLLSRHTHLNRKLESGHFTEIVGQGDIDPAISNRLETGLMAISAHTHKKPSAVKLASLPPQRPLSPSRTSEHRVHDKNWAVQVGAFSSRAQTDRAVHDAVKRLPYHLTHISPSVAPLKTNAGWIFRARLNGYTKAQAFQACQVLDGCLTIAPR